MEHTPTDGHQHEAGGHADHDHAGAPLRVLAIVLALTLSFTVVEAVGGLVTGSLALLADAGHMVSDDFSLAFALFAAWIGRRPPTARMTFGFRRAEILAALANGVTLVAISIWIFVEAYERFRDPPQVLGGWMLGVAVVGLIVNIVGAAILMRGHGDNLNIAAALRHVLADLLGSVGAIAAALIILATGWLMADPLMSVLIAALVLYSSWSILRDSVMILLEATPDGISAEAIHQRMLAQDGVAEVHDLHIWTIASGFAALAAHIRLSPGQDPGQRRRALEQLLAAEFGIRHTTLQVDDADDQHRDSHGEDCYQPPGEAP